MLPEPAIPETVSISDAGTLTLGGAVTGNTITLGTSSNGNLALGNNNITASGTSNSVTLSANGSGNITDGSGMITGSTVALSSGTGNIGTQRK